MSDKGVVHSLRHLFRDRLRHIDCPGELIDQVGGWSRASVGTKYGLGYPLDVTLTYFKKVYRSELSYSNTRHPC